jgi:hypothetical protein
LAVERLEERTLLSSSGPATQALQAAYGQLSFAFEANQGQAAAPINFVARGAGYVLSLMPTEAVLGLQKSAGTPAAGANASPGDVVQLQLVGANPAAPAIGLGELITKTNYFLGGDPSQWRTNVANFGKVEYQNVYPGVNLVYYGNQGQLEYDFVIAPGADPGVISLSVQGTQGMTLDGQGNLVLHTGGGDLVEQAPLLYQKSAGVHQAVAGRFVLEGKNQVGFQVGAYDASRPLVIDPVLSYATYLGGSGQDWGVATAVDGSGDAYVTGLTYSNDFPTVSALLSAFQGSEDAFVTKLNATGTALIYSTYLGGSLTPAGALASNSGYGIAVDSVGNAYVTGNTNAKNFPTTSSAFQTSYGGGSQNAFVAKLSASGSLMYATYLGGSGTDGAASVHGNPIAVDASGDAYVVGSTSSTNFPTTSNAYQATLVGTSAGYITEVNATGTGLLYSTYLTGGPGSSIALNVGEVYVTGGTGSANLPTTSGAYQKKLIGSDDVFVAVLNPLASTRAAQLVYVTYLGRSSSGNAIAVDSSGNAYVTGYTFSAKFPTTAGAFQIHFPRGAEVSVAFVAKINPSGSGSASLIYSTYLGGNNALTQAEGIAVDSSGDAYVTGLTDVNFPTTANAIQPSLGNAYQAAFVTTLNASGSALLISTYLGGTGKQNRTVGLGIALDGSGNTYVTGFVTAFNGYPLNFPVTAGAFQTTSGGGYDAFVAKISPVVSAAAAPSANLGKELPVELTATLLSLPSIAGSIDPPRASAAGGGAPQGTVLAPVVVFSQPLAPLLPGADAGPHIPRAIGLRARSDDLLTVSQTAFALEISSHD